MKLYSLLVTLAVNISFSYAEICISGTSTTNNVFYGNYQQAVDENNNTYYIKDSDGICDEDDEFLYKRFGKWQTNQELNKGAYALRCPTATTNPYDCPSGTWLNAGNTDSDITVENTACPGNVHK